MGLWQKLINKGMQGHVKHLVAHLKVAQQQIGSFDEMSEYLDSQNIHYEISNGIDDDFNRPYEMVWWIKFRVNYSVYIGMINGGSVIRATFEEWNTPLEWGAHLNQNLSHIALFISEDSIHYRDDGHGYNLPAPTESIAFITCLESCGITELPSEEKGKNR